MTSVTTKQASGGENSDDICKPAGAQDEFTYGMPVYFFVFLSRFFNKLAFNIKKTLRKERIFFLLLCSIPSYLSIHSYIVT